MPAYYALYDDAGRWEYVTGQILVAEFDAIAQSIPSLLGWDVLRYFDIHLQSATGTVVLERSPS